jgi:TrpR-related protein YerC/YecD
LLKCPKDKETTKNINDLLEAVLLLRSTEEAQMFLRDLLTEKELIEFGKRWKAARLLADSVPYSQIIEQTGLSTATVVRISRWLSAGTGGYQLMLDRIQGRKKKQLHQS